MQCALFSIVIMYNAFTQSVQLTQRNNTSIYYYYEKTNNTKIETTINFNTEYYNNLNTFNNYRIGNNVLSECSFEYLKNIYRLKSFVNDKINFYNLNYNIDYNDHFLNMDNMINNKIKQNVTSIFSNVIDRILPKINFNCSNIYASNLFYLENCFKNNVSDSCNKMSNVVVKTVLNFKSNYVFNFRF